MFTENINVIINFAIEREKEAVAFYQDLQSKASFKAQKEMLKEFEDMEKGHIVILENIRTKSFQKIEEKRVQDLHISDYIIEVEPSENMTFQNIIILAMKKEEAAKKLYTNLAKQFSGSESGKLFERLAAEEAEHKLKFEKIYDDEILKEN
ncbi:MAG: ferritin family protein [Candidatus Cloacimonetes bacterium]|nr:ferritin family protein [Candidatus Cloacimonadota bacterium]